MGPGPALTIMAKARVKRLPTQAERKVARQSIGTLHDAMVTVGTSRRYHSAVTRFLIFLESEGHGLPATFPALDQLVVYFIERLWVDGDPKHLAGDCLSGLRHYIPATRGQLNGSWRLLSAWGRCEMPLRAPPLTQTFLYAVAWYFRSQNWTDSMVLLCLGFHTFARSGELFAAKKRHFVLDWHRGYGTWTLPLSKGGQRRGVQEALTITDPWVVALLQGFLVRLGDDDYLRRSGAPVQRERLRKANSALQLPADYQWYSVRRGGATHALRFGGDIAGITERGRWGNAATARIYIQDAQAALSELQVPTLQMQALVTRANSVRPGIAM